MPTSHELLSTATGILAELGLDETLRTIGVPTLVGSAALDVMVAHDIDLTVTVPDLTAAASAIARLGAELSLHDQVHRVQFRNDTGRWNADPAYPDGRYLGIGYADWTLDIWFVDEPDRQPDLQHLKTLLPRLTDADRQVIIEIKQSLLADPPTGGRGPSYDVYVAVLDHGITDRAGFDARNRS
jgi:hypothetical protein